MCLCAPQFLPLSKPWIAHYIHKKPIFSSSYYCNTLVSERTEYIILLWRKLISGTSLCGYLYINASRNLNFPQYSLNEIHLLQVLISRIFRSTIQAGGQFSTERILMNIMNLICQFLLSNVPKSIKNYKCLIKGFMPSQDSPFPHRLPIYCFSKIAQKHIKSFKSKNRSVTSNFQQGSFSLFLYKNWQR